MELFGRIIILSPFALLFVIMTTTSATSFGGKRVWGEEDVQYLTDVELERLLQQWEENDEPLEPDELPEHLRPLPKMDLSKLDLKNPEDLLKMSKKGKSVMMFIDMQSTLSEEQADITTRIWQTGLQNNHITVERYPIENKRYIFMFHDGSQALEGRDYLLQHPEVAHVTLEGQTYYPSLEKKEQKLEDEL